MPLRSVGRDLDHVVVDGRLRRKRHPERPLLGRIDYEQRHQQEAIAA